MKNNPIVNLKKLNTFLRKNKAVDLRQADLNHASNIDAYNWKSLEEDKESLLIQLKAYQRLLRVFPHDEIEPTIAKALLKKGIHSALQIAGMSKQSFIKETVKEFRGNSELAGRVYQKAVICRKTVALNYLNQSQQSEPHARAAGLHI